MSTAKTKSNLPTLAELHNSPAEAFKNDKFLELVNAPVPEKWLKKHPIVKVKNEQNENVALKYLPIDKVEFLLQRIFQQHRVEIRSMTAIMNSVCAVVRLHVLHPITGEWTFHDGVGAVAAQTDKESNAADLSAIKSNAIQIGVPAAVSYAIKDAAEHFGAIFGRDLNKRDVLPFTGAYSKEAEQRQPYEMPKEEKPTVTVQMNPPKEKTTPAPVAPQTNGEGSADDFVL